MSTQSKKARHVELQEYPAHPHNQDIAFFMAIFLFFMGTCLFIGAANMGQCGLRICFVTSYHVTPCGIREGPCFSVYPFVNVSRTMSGRFAVGPFPVQNFMRQFKTMDLVQEFQTTYPPGHAYECSVYSASREKSVKDFVIVDDCKDYPSSLPAEAIALLLWFMGVGCSIICYAYYASHSRVPDVIDFFLTKRIVVTVEDTKKNKKKPAPNAASVPLAESQNDIIVDKTHSE